MRPFTSGSPYRFPGSNFAAPYNGIDWLGPTLVTPAIIGSFLWIWVGFAMIVIGAGLAAIPRETLEAARTDGANEWQVFRRVTAPLLRPVLLVVLAVYAARGACLTRESAAGRIGTGMLLGMLGLAIVWLVQVPFGLAGLWWDRRYDVSDQGYVEWLLEDWWLLGSEFLS